MTEATLTSDLAFGKGRSLWSDARRRLLHRKLVVASLIVIAVFVLIAVGVYTGLIAGKWNEQVGLRYEGPSLKHGFGTDFLGRSVWCKTLYGAKISLTVAFLASLISICIGLPLGAIAGYFRGWIDDVIVWFFTTINSIPPIILILAFAFVLEGRTLFGYPLRGISVVYLVIGLTSWVGLCRLIRGEVIKHRDRDYVTAARAYGCSRSRIILRHVIPNVIHLVIINFSLRFVSFIHAEVILSFLGLGVKGEPSWGVMIDDARQELYRGCWWQLAAATLAIGLISLALNIVGDALRDALDPKLRQDLE
jgi:peptide/nickel transport system permease protein